MLANLGIAGQYCGNLMWEPSGLVLCSGGPTKGAPATRTHVLGSRSAAHIHQLIPPAHQESTVRALSSLLSGGPPLKCTH